MSLCVADSVDLGLARFDFVGAGNIWVDDSLVDDSSVRFVQYLIGNAALQSWVWVEVSRPPAMRSIRSW